MLPHLAQVACLSECPPNNRTEHFANKVSIHSARGRLIQHCSHGHVAALYATILRDAPEHVHHLPSILVPQTSHSLIAMSHSVPTNQLANPIFLRALLRKLRLPIFNPAAPPLCWCGQRHDCFGDHAFCCVANNKKMAHNMLRDGFAAALQRPLASAGYILPASKLETEKPNTVPSNPNLGPSTCPSTLTQRWPWPQPGPAPTPRSAWIPPLPGPLPLRP